MDDYITSRLEEFVEQSGEDLEVEDVREDFEAKLAKVDERAMESLDDQTRVDYAVGMLSSEDLRKRRSGPSAEEMEIRILSIGQRGTWNDHPAINDYDGDVVTAHGLIRAPVGDGGEVKTGKAVLFIRDDHVNSLEAQTKFHELNTVRATMAVEDAWSLDGFFRAYSTEQTDLVEEEFDDLPASRDEKNSLLRQAFPDVALADLAENGKGLSSYDPDTDGLYTRDWGADIKRFTGRVVDYYIPDDRSWGRYTLTDISVTPDDLEGSEATLPSGDTASVIGSNQQVPGLTVWADPDYHMTVGNDSTVDVYGVIEVNADDGQISMRAAGVVPIVPMDMEDEETTEDSGVQSKKSKL